MKRFFAILCCCFTFQLLASFEKVESEFHAKNYNEAILLLNDLVASLDAEKLFTNYKSVAKASYWYSKCYEEKNDLLLAHNHLVRAEYFLKYDSLNNLNKSINIGFGSVLYKLNLYDEALSYLNKNNTSDADLLKFKSLVKLNSPEAISIFSRLKKEDKTYENQLDFIQYLKHLDSLDLAENIALDLLNSTLSDKEEKAVLLQLGFITKRKGEHTKSLDYLNKILKKNSSVSTEVLVRSIIGIVEFEVENYPVAIDQLLVAINLQEKNGLTKHLANNYNHLSNFNLRLGEIALAIKNANKALKCADENDWKTRSISYEILIKANEYLDSKRKVQKYTASKNEMLEKGKQLRLDRVEKSNAVKMNITKSKNRLLESLQLQHFGRLAYQNIKLANKAKEEKLQLELSQKALDQEKMLHTKAELLSQLRSEEVEQLSQQNQISQLQLEKHELEKIKNEKQFNLLKSENELNELKLEVQNNTLAQQRLNQRLMIALSMILLLTIGFFFYRYRVKQKSKEFKLSQRKLEVESLLFRAQMNPHFLFNSLNSIKGLILSDKTIDADNYLTKFAGLMRHILNNSETSYVQLSKEIDMLKLYMDLENLRFDDAFSYSIELDEFLEEEDTYIPSMIIQPHIENAILHGLKSRGPGGKIDIKISDEDDYYKITITDNGIGRERSQEIKKETYQAYKSKATQLISKQIVLLQQEERNVDMEIIDLFEKEQPVGTKVVLKLPLRLRPAV